MNNQAWHLRVALYIRVSTAEQVQEWYWLDTQDRILRSFVASNEDKWWIINESLVYRDEWYSWATDVEERPWLSRLHSDIIDGKVDIVLVWKIDRLFRKTSYLLEYIDFLKKHDVNFVSKNESIDLSSPTGKLVLTLLGAIWEMERDVITERTHEGKLSKAMQWYFVYGKYVPYWYMLEDDWHGKRIVVNPDTSKVVKEIFDMYVKEWKTSWEIARILTARWIGTDKDKDGVKVHPGLFRTSEIGDILRNEIYIWKYYCNKRSIKRENGRQIAVTKDPSEWILISVDPLVEEEIWKNAQEILAKAQIYQWRWNTHMFTGIVRCWECGKAYHYYKNQKGKGNYRCWWRDYNRVAKENYCTNWGISEDKLMVIVWDKISLLLKNPLDFINAYESQKIDSGKVTQQERLESELLEISDLLFKKKQVKKDALRKMLESPLDADEYKQIIEDVAREIQVLTERESYINRELNSYQKHQKTRESIISTSEKLHSGVLSLTHDEKMEIIRNLVDVIIVGNNSVEVVYRFKSL